MKKILLSALSVVTIGGAFAQHDLNLTPAQYNFKVEVPVHFLEQDVPNAENYPLIGNSNVAQRSATETQIGESYYDLQTNSAIQRRIINHSSGAITATWTFSTDAAWTNRGTGYNYFNGTTWGAYPASEIETERTGWPNPLAPNDGSEIIISHSTANSIFHRVNRASVGTGAWSQGNMSNQDGQVWGRSAVGGSNNNTIHKIGMTLPVANNGTLYNGMDGAFLYSRSNDGGANFNIVDYQIPGTNVNYFDGFDGDSYAIDADGNNVAIAVGGLGRGVQLFKSSDNGVTWTKTDVMTSAIWFQEDQTVVDTTLEGRLWTSDGAVAVLLDDNGDAHVWFSTMYIANADITDGTITYYPYTNGMQYWNEDYPSDNSLRLFGFIDIDGDGQISMDNPGGQYRFSGLVSHPSAGVDDEGCFYLSYDMVREDLTTGAQNYRHTYVSKSCDGGCSWSFPIDVTGSPLNDFVECVFPSIARHVDDDIHILYMGDNEPGIAVSGDEDNPVINQMIYLKEDAERFDTVSICPTEIAGDSLLCAGGSVSLEALGCASTYAWTGPNSFSSSNQVINATDAGLYTCVYTTTCGTQTETFNVVNYTGGQTLTVNVSATSLEICPSGSETITATSNIAGASYLWSTGSTADSIIVSAAGTYTVTVTDCSGATETETVTLVAPSAPTAIISGDLTLCPSETNTLTVVPVTGATNYAWSTGATGINATSINVSSAGTYQVTVTNCAGSSNTSVTVTEEDEPVAVITDNGLVGCEGEVLTVVASGGTEFEWSDGSTTAALSINAASQSGTYTVTVSNDCGDEDTEEVTLTINAQPAAPTITYTGGNYVSSGTGTHTWFIDGVQTTETSNMLSDNNVQAGDEITVSYEDENGCVSELSAVFIGITGISDIDAMNSKYAVYPNPSKGLVEVRFTDLTGNVNLTVTNSLGQVVYRTNTDANGSSVYSLDLTSLASGTYQLSVEHEEGVGVQSLIIE